MNNKFKVDDKVRYGTAEGVVWAIDHALHVVFKDVLVIFGLDGSYFRNLPGQPVLELIERPEKTHKVKVWRWEKVHRLVDGWYVEQSISLHSEDDWHVKNGWTKVPGSEREIEVEMEDKE